MQNFLDKADYQEWKRRCIKQRYVARMNPCTDSAMVQCVDYETHLEMRDGTWNLRLVLERFLAPAIWHASISYFKKIGDQVVLEKRTGLPIFEAPEFGLLLPREWSKEEKDVARSLLGDLMGPLIAGKTQQVLEQHLPDGLALHWMTTEADAVKYAAQRN